MAHIFATGAYMAKETLLQTVSQLFNVKAFNHEVFSNISPKQIVGEYVEAVRSKNLPWPPAGTITYHTVANDAGTGAFSWHITSQPVSASAPVTGAGPAPTKAGYILFNAGSIFRYNWTETRRHLGMVSLLYHAYDKNGQLLSSAPTGAPGNYGPAAILVLISHKGKAAWILVRNGVSANIAPVVASLQRSGYIITVPNTGANTGANTCNYNGSCSTSSCSGNPASYIAAASAGTVSCEPRRVVSFKEIEDINPFSNMVSRQSDGCDNNSSSSYDSYDSDNEQQDNLPSAPFCSDSVSSIINEQPAGACAVAATNIPANSNNIFSKML